MATATITSSNTSSNTSPKSSLKTPWGALPPQIRALYISTTQRTGSWLAEAFATDSASNVSLEEAQGAGVALARLRDEIFDAVLISHEPGEIDALEMVDGMRASSPDQAIIIMGTQSEQEMSAVCYEVGADAYVCVNTATTRWLIWTVARSVEHHNLISENRRLRQAEQHRYQQEHQEVGRLLAQQRKVISHLEQASGKIVAPEDSIAENSLSDRCFPAVLIDHYRELLRTYIIMGSGNLAAEMGALAELFVSSGVTGRHTLLLHLHVLEEMIDSLGNRSARHVMNRADLLIVEVMVHLAEGYRCCYLDRVNPPRQKRLPGFE